MAKMTMEMLIPNRGISDLTFDLVALACQRSGAPNNYCMLDKKAKQAKNWNFLFFWEKMFRSLNDMTRMFPSVNSSKPLLVTIGV